MEQTLRVSPGRRLPLALVLFAALLVQGCAEAAEGSPLANARASEEALIRDFFRALERHDAAAVQALLITRGEYEALMWPEMPDRRQMPIDFSWSLKQASRRKGLRQLMSNLGGVPLELESVTWTKDPEVYPSFTIHKGASVVARRADTGQRGEVASFDVFVEYGRGWKLLDLDEL